MTPPPDLLQRTAALVDVASVSHDEAQLAELVFDHLRALPHIEVTRSGDAVIARTAFKKAHRLLLGGHLDTVRPADNEHARIDADTLWGLGSCDMKGGLAIMLALAEQVKAPAVDLTFVFYECEEVGRQFNGLSRLLAERPDLLAADAAVLCEPTDGYIEAGCQGTLRCELTLGGQRAHTARPWMGVNAIHRMGEAVRLVESAPLRTPLLDGCTYREAMQAVAISGGVAGNVVPDSATLAINHRFAPDRSAQDAFAAIRTLLDPVIDETQGDKLVLVDYADGAMPGLSNPVLAALSQASDAPARAKLGWTDVAFFAERGIPALNLGPGDPTVAHMANEHVTKQSLERAFTALWAAIHTDIAD